MKFLVVPDSFKGGMSAKRVCEIVKTAINSVYENAEIKCFPALDGGEGSSEYLTEIYGGKTVGGKVTDGNFFVKNGTYGVSSDMAFIAVANSSGLPSTLIKNPLFTTSYGLGEQISQALKLKKKVIIIGLGGSSTNDGGAGVASALGVKFYNKDEETFVPTGGNLKEIARIDIGDLDKRISGVKFIGLCDVVNPLIGENGCSYVFAKQKGAKTKEQQDELEENMRYYAEKTAFLGVKANEKGNGSAGGIGYFVRAFLRGELVSGADWFLDAIKFEKEVKEADIVICGEGKFDSTSNNGKICGRIINRANKLGKEVVVLCGERGDDGKEDSGKVKVLEINDKSKSLEENIRDSEGNLLKAMKRFIRMKKGYFF